jgi:hypothetical protein
MKVWMSSTRKHERNVSTEMRALPQLLPGDAESQDVRWLGVLLAFLEVSSPGMQRRMMRLYIIFAAAERWINVRSEVGIGTDDES